jgi:hypothetical protein
LPTSAAPGYHVAGAKQPPPCTHAGKPIALPKGFPQQFPFPAGTAITHAEHRKYGLVLITGYIPSNSFKDTESYFKNYLPLAGFDTEKFVQYNPEEVSGEWEGHHFAGHWSLTAFPPGMCKGQIIFGASAIPGNIPPG